MSTVFAFRAARSGHGWRRRVAAAAIGVVGLGALVAYEASSATPLASAASSRTLTIGLAFPGSSLNPALDTDGSWSIIRSLTNESLTHLNANGTITPQLAASFHYVGKGNRTFEFTLRHDARFSDGASVNAAAVKTWLTYFSQAHGPFGGDIPLQSVQTVGKWTVVMHLSEPSPVMPRMLSEEYNWGAVSSPTAVATPTTLGTQPDGAGPYELQASGTVAGQHYTFVPNPYYYNKSAIKYATVAVSIIPNPSSMLQAFNTGQVDVAYGDPTTAGSVSSSSGAVLAAPTGTMDGLVFLDRGGKIAPPLADVRVRQALNYAINRSAISSGLFGKYATPTSELPTADGWIAKSVNQYAYNPAKAKSLLAAAGYSKGLTLNAVDVGGVGTKGDPLVQAMAQYLAAVGVTLKITTEASYPSFVPQVLSGTFPATWLVQGSGDDPMWLIYLNLLKPHAVLNPLGADDPTLDKLWQEGASARVSAKFWTQMAQRMINQADLLPVLDFDNIYYVAKGVGGVSVAEKGFEPFASEWFPK